MILDPFNTLVFLTSQTEQAPDGLREAAQKVWEQYPPKRLYDFVQEQCRPVLKPVDLRTPAWVSPLNAYVPKLPSVPINKEPVLLEDQDLSGSPSSLKTETEAESRAWPYWLGGGAVVTLGAWLFGGATVATGGSVLTVAGGALAAGGAGVLARALGPKAVEALAKLGGAGSALAQRVAASKSAGVLARVGQALAQVDRGQVLATVGKIAGGNLVVQGVKELSWGEVLDILRKQYPGENFSSADSSSSLLAQEPSIAALSERMGQIDGVQSIAIGGEPVFKMIRLSDHEGYLVCLQSGGATNIERMQQLSSHLMGLPESSIETIVDSQGQTIAFRYSPWSGIPLESFIMDEGGLAGWSDKQWQAMEEHVIGYMKKKLDEGNATVVIDRYNFRFLGRDEKGRPVVELDLSTLTPQEIQQVFGLDGAPPDSGVFPIDIDNGEMDFANGSSLSSVKDLAVRKAHLASQISNSITFFRYSVNAQKFLDTIQ